MASRKDIATDIKNKYGTILNIKDCMELFKVSRNKAKDLLKEVPSYDFGKDKKYLAIDLARMLEQMEIL
jgi:hypothetical protein